MTPARIIQLTALSLVMCSSAFAKKQPPPGPPLDGPEIRFEEVCYELSPDGKEWSKTRELLCVRVGSLGDTATITLKLGTTEVAAFQLTLTSRLEAANRNADVFAVASPRTPRTSVWNAVTIRFDGKRKGKEGSRPESETGSVSIGKATFRYRLATR